MSRLAEPLQYDYYVEVVCDFMNEYLGLFGNI